MASLNSEMHFRGLSKEAAAVEAARRDFLANAGVSNVKNFNDAQMGLYHTAMQNFRNNPWTAYSENQRYLM